MITIDFKPCPIEAEFARFGRSFQQNADTFARWSGRVMAHRMFVETNPVSQMGNMFPTKRAHERIARDVELMYPSWDDADWFSGVYRMVKMERGEDAASEWWSTYKKNEAGYYDADEAYDPATGDFTTKKKRKSALETAKTRGFIKARRPDDTRYRSKRKHNAAPGSFSKDEPPIAMVNNVSARRGALQRQQKRALMAKAAWKMAADAFGPTKNIGKGAFKMIWPRQANVTNSATGGRVGHGSFIATDSTIYIKAENKIRYASEAITADHFTKAVENAKRQMTIVLDQRLKAILRRKRPTPAKKAA